MVLHFTVRRSAPLTLAGDLLMFLGLGAVLYFVWFEWDGASYQQVQRAEFLKSLTENQDQPATEKRQVATGTAALKSTRSTTTRGTTAKDTRVFAQLTIPDVNLDVMVREGVDDDTLRLAVGHLGSSAKPGERGNLVLFGHRDTFFRPLRELSIGDVAEVRTTSGLFRYRIDEIRVVGPDDLDVTQPQDRSAITLITCFPFKYIGPSPRRYVAHGLLVTTN